MNIEQKNTDKKPIFTRAIAGIAAVAALGVAGGGYAAKHSHETTPSSPQPVAEVFESTPTIDADTEDQLLVHQAQFDGDSTNVPEGVMEKPWKLNAVYNFNVQTGIIVDAEEAYRAAHKIESVDEIPPWIKESITVTANSLTKRDRLQGEGAIQPDTTLVLNEVTDDTGQDWAVVTEPAPENKE